MTSFDLQELMGDLGQQCEIQGIKKTDRRVPPWFILLEKGERGWESRDKIG